MKKTIIRTAVRFVEYKGLDSEGKPLLLENPLFMLYGHHQDHDKILKKIIKTYGVGMYSIVDVAYRCDNIQFTEEDLVNVGTILYTEVSPNWVGLTGEEVELVAEVSENE